MDYKDTLERINYFEELLPINQMELLGINIWPILRTFYVTSNDKNNFSKTKFTINKLKIFDFNLKKIKSHDLFFSYANDPSGTIKLDNKYIQKQAFVLKKYKSNNLKTIEFGLTNDSNKRDSFQITGLYVFFKIFYFFNYKKKKILQLELTNLKERIKQFINPSESLPAVGQGSLGIEILSDNNVMSDFLKPLNDEDTARCVLAERAVSRKLAGSCTVPLGAFATINNDRFLIKGFVSKPDGSQIIHAEKSGLKSEFYKLGEALGDALIANGAKDILSNL